VPPAPSELRIDFSIVDDDEREAIYEIQVLSGPPGREHAQESEAIEVQGNTPAGGMEDVRYGGGNNGGTMPEQRITSGRPPAVSTEVSGDESHAPLHGQYSRLASRAGWVCG
jgi:hypothetical protein